MRLYFQRILTSEHKIAGVEVRWASLKKEVFMDLKVDAAVFTDPDAAEAYADLILEAVARMRSHRSNRLEDTV